MGNVASHLRPSGAAPVATFSCSDIQLRNLRFELEFSKLTFGQSLNMAALSCREHMPSSFPLDAGCCHVR